MPFMPAVNLNQWSGALPTWSCLGRFFSIGFFFSVFAAACSAGSIFWLPQRLLSERELLLVLGLSFYPLEQAPNMVIYAMSKSATATSGLI
jgi:hypothetical protein